MSYFNTFKSVWISVERCRGNQSEFCDWETDLLEFWKETAIAIHILSNDIDLTAYENQGKPTQNFEFRELIELSEYKIGNDR